MVLQHTVSDHVGTNVCDHLISLAKGSRGGATKVQAPLVCCLFSNYIVNPRDMGNAGNVIIYFFRAADVTFIVAGGAEKQPH